jgi:hypothetical protein
MVNLIGMIRIAQGAIREREFTVHCGRDELYMVPSTVHDVLRFPGKPLDPAFPVMKPRKAVSSKDYAARNSAGNGTYAAVRGILHK